MTLPSAALLMLLALAPKPRAVGYSFEAGRCSEQVPAGGTLVHSRLAVGTTARLSALFEFAKPCGSRGKRLPCRATPSAVKASGAIRLTSVRGGEIRLEARSPGPGAVAVRARKKQFPELALNAALPVGLAAQVGALPPAELRALRIVQGGSVALSLAAVDEDREPLCAGGKVPVSAPALGIGAGATWDLTAQKEVHATGLPGWSFLELRLGGQRLQMPVEIVAPRAVQRVVLEPRRTQQGPLRVAVRAYDDTGEVLGASVRLWLDGDGSLLGAGRADRQALRELQTTDPEVAVVPGRAGEPMILSAQAANGITARLDVQATQR